MAKPGITVTTLPQPRYISVAPGQQAILVSDQVVQALSSWTGPVMMKMVPLGGGLCDLQSMYPNGKPAAGDEIAKFIRNITHMRLVNRD